MFNIDPCLTDTEYLFFIHVQLISADAITTILHAMSAGYSNAQTQSPVSTRNNRFFNEFFKDVKHLLYLFTKYIWFLLWIYNTKY